MVSRYVNRWRGGSWSSSVSSLHSSTGWLVPPGLSLVLALQVVLGLQGCSDSNSVQLAPHRTSPAQRAGSETCAQCHPAQVDQWSRNPMARSLEPTSLGELDGLGSVVDEASGFEYRFARSSDNSGHIIGEESSSAPEHALGCDVLFAIGAGVRDRSYAVGHGAGMWFAPVEVVTYQEGRAAVLAPHAAMEPGSRFGFPITSECLGCHTDALPPDGFPLNLRQPESVWTPRGISCVACHGGADEHATWQSAANSAAGEDPLVSHAQLDREAQLSVCAACHLQGDTRLVLDGPDLGPPKPGGDLVDSRALFVAREATEEVGFVSHVERLVLSQCYLQSEMTCTSCHDPHRSLREPGEHFRVSEACMDCHAPATPRGQSGTSSAQEPSASSCSRPHPELSGDWPPWVAYRDDSSAPDCVDCHMPRTGVFDVARVTIHDHFIRRLPTGVRGPYADGELRALESPGGDWKRFQWPGRDPGWGVDTGIWFMAYASKGFTTRALERLDEPPGPRALAIPMFHHLRAGLLRSVGRLEEARVAYQRALELDPELTESAINLGLLLAELGDREQGVQMLNRVVEKHPAAWSALRNRAVLRSGGGDLPGALSDLQRAFAAMPSAEVAGALAKLTGGMGDQAAAASWKQVARQLDPAWGGAAQRQ